MRNRVIAGALVALVALAACGGSKSSDSAASDFCAKAQGAHDALNGFDTIGELKDPSAVKAVFTTAIDAVGAARELSTMQVSHSLGTAMQVARTAVVPQAAPQRQDLVHASLPQIRHSGKPFQESPVIAQHGRNLGLLQHDFRQPDAVGVARALPRQAVPTVLPAPVPPRPCTRTTGSPDP